MTLTATDQHAVAYVRRLRNTRKREYARAYLLWAVRTELGTFGDEPEPAAPAGLSYMGAQSVRIALGNILRGDA